jgi:RNA polymerase sigma-70 factor
MKASLALEDHLVQVVAAARARWSDVDVSTEVFLRHLASKLDSGADLALATSQLNTSDLYLAVGCTSGLAEAQRAFEANFFPDVDAIVRRTRNTGIDADEIRQLLREKLFLADEGPNKLASYSGKGDLRGWFRVVATRTLLSAIRSASKERGRSSDDELLNLPAPGGSEMDHMRRYYAEELRAVFPEALAALSSADRRLLRQRYLDGLTHDEMATLNRIHRATVKRHLLLAQKALRGALRTLLMKRLGLTTAEFESILRTVRDEFHVTLRRLLVTE